MSLTGKAAGSAMLRTRLPDSVAARRMSAPMLAAEVV